MTVIDEQTIPQANRDTNTHWLTKITVADLCLLLIVGLAAILRWSNLDALPLNPTEAENALSVWQFWQPAAEVPTIQSPAYFTLTGLVSQLIGVSDGLMRLIPALFGVATVSLAWFWQKRLGYAGAFVLALLLTFSPILTIISRTASGASISLFALFFLVTAWVKFDESGNMGWFYALWGALGVGLASSPLFWSGLFTLMLSLFMTRRNQNSEEALTSPWQGLTRPTWRTGAWVGGLTTLMLGTFFLWYPNGSVPALLGDWFGWFLVQGQADLLLSPLLALARYEPHLILFALPLIGWGVSQADRLQNILGYWLSWLILLILVQQGEHLNSALILLPSSLLLASFMKFVWIQASNTVTWATTGGAFFVGMVAWVQLARYSRVSLYSPAELQYLLWALTAVLLCLVCVYIAGSYDTLATIQGVLLGFLMVVWLFQWGNGWRLGQVAGNDPRERWVMTTATADDMPRLRHTLQTIAWQVDNYEQGLHLFSAIDTPVTRWYLRDFQRATFGETVPLEANYEAILSYENDSLTLGSDYIGGDFSFMREPTERVSSQKLFMDTIRWWFFQQSSTPLVESKLILWIRSDVTTR